MVLHALAAHTNQMVTFVLPMFLFWDALAMMMLGMALYKSGVLQAERPRSFYLWLTVVGFFVGLAVNGFEIWRATQSNFSVTSTFAQMQFSYHFGRLGMALGWLGAVVLFCQSGALQLIREALSRVGKMALTNYLMHSVICLFLFTGAGFGLLGQFSRAELYGIVIAIWVFQLITSYFWMARFRFGPLEWLWRWLTYGVRPALVR